MKEKIIEKAAELFLTVGFKSITMDDIASKMGISKKTLYKYFANKELLVDETTMDFQRKIHTKIEDIIAKNYNPIKELFEIKKSIQGFFQITETSPLYQLKKHYPETHEKLMSCEQEECTQFFRQNIP
jgi:AcrR family transcriptional regulator